MTERSPKPVTAAYLDRAAVYYLERYGSSSENLRRVLVRKARRRSADPAMPDEATRLMIDETVARAVRSGLVDDRSFAEGRLATLLRKGSSARDARNKLAAKGVPAELVAQALQEAAPDELAQARRFAERRRLGPWRRVPDPAARDKDMAALARAGFPYRVARAALEGGPEDE